MTQTARKPHPAPQELKEHFNAMVAQAYAGFEKIWREEDPVTTSVTLKLTVDEWQALGVSYITSAINLHIERHRKGYLRFTWRINWPGTGPIEEHLYKLVFKIQLM